MYCLPHFIRCSPAPTLPSALLFPLKPLPLFGSSQARTLQKQPHEFSRGISNNWVVWNYQHFQVSGAKFAITFITGLFSLRSPGPVPSLRPRPPVIIRPLLTDMSPLAQDHLLPDLLSPYNFPEGKQKYFKLRKQPVGLYTAQMMSFGMITRSRGLWETAVWSWTPGRDRGNVGPKPVTLRLSGRPQRGSHCTVTPPHSGLPRETQKYRLEWGWRTCSRPSIGWTAT